MPTSSRYTFYGCPAYLKQVLGQRRCEVWLSKTEAQRYSTVLENTETPSFATLDLGATPLRQPDEVQVDDYVAAAEPGLTRLGGEWPNSSRGPDAHAAEAAVYLEESQWSAHRQSGRLEWPPAAGTQDYQYESRLYVDFSTTGMRIPRRYYGFRARLIELLSSGRAVFEVFEVLSTSPRRVWIDLRSLEDCDGTQSFQNAGEEGPLFLRWSFARDHNLREPKLPVGLARSPFRQVLELFQGAVTEGIQAPRVDREFVASTLGDLGEGVFPEERRAVMGGYPR